MNELKTGALQGDSSTTIPAWTIHADVSGVRHTVRMIANNYGRLAGFELGPIQLPSIGEALNIGEQIGNRIQRSAAIANVPLRFATIRAMSTDREEQNEAKAIFFPVVDLLAPDPAPFPALELLLSVLAEGRRNTSIFYRALVFFKIVETYIDKVQPSLNKTFHASGLQLKELSLKLPPDPFRLIDPSLIGKSYTVYRTEVQNRIRDVIAHLDPESEIAPFDFASEGEVRKASIVLHFIATEIVGHFSKTMQILAGKDLTAATTFRFDGIDKRRNRGKKRSRK